MKRICAVSLLVLLLLAFSVVPAVAETSELTASVTIETLASVTITDTSPAGLQFGLAEPGDDMLPEANSPSVVVTAASENNVSVDITLSGLDFSDGATHSFDVTNAYWNTSNESGTADTVKLAASADTVATLTAGQSVSIYHWLSIPDGQYAGSYTSTFTYTSN